MKRWRLCCTAAPLLRLHSVGNESEVDSKRARRRFCGLHCFTAERSRLFDGFIMLDCFVLEYGALCASEGVGDLHQKSLLHSLSITFSLSLSSAVVARSESLCLKLTLWSPSVMLATVCAASVEPGCCVR